MSVYKKFTPQDYSIIPFNAHKQYDFTSASADLNRVTHFNTRWTSESISNYSTHPLSESVDTINAIKYYQLDSIFYRNFRKIDNVSTGTKYLGQNDINYLKHRRVLYEKANILSTPTNLYGHEIKPKSIYLSSSIFEFKDDGEGNLLLYNEDTDDFIIDVRKNVLNLGPVNGFKRYDLNTFEGYFVDGKYGYFYRDGVKSINPVTSYSTPEGIEYDDSYFFNQIKYKNVNFSEQTLFRGNFPSIDFNGVNSEVKLGDDGKFYFNKGDDFTITLWVNVENEDLSSEAYLISKSTTKDILPQVNPIQNTFTTGALSNTLITAKAEPQHPFEVYVKNVNSTPFVFFSRSDGEITSLVSSSITTSSIQHITCMSSDSQMEIYINGIGSGISGSDITNTQTQNTANIYIGNKGGESNFLSGSLSQINVYNTKLSEAQVKKHYSSSNGSPYVGNVFYQSGMTTITHPDYITALADSSAGNIFKYQFQGSHLVYEHEYQCTVDEHEFNATQNISARKIRSSDSEELADFATGSLFKPYVTTVGLYNEDNELLVVGKLGSPIKMSNETDTTFVLRWDT